jgi:hypothetical protein
MILPPGSKEGQLEPALRILEEHPPSATTDKLPAMILLQNPCKNLTSTYYSQTRRDKLSSF